MDNPKPVEQKETRSILAVEFAGIGQSDFKVSMLNVSPSQLFAAAGYLKWLSETEMTKMQNASQVADSKNKIAIATSPLS